MLGASVRQNRRPASAFGCLTELSQALKVLAANDPVQNWMGIAILRELSLSSEQPGKLKASLAWLKNVEMDVLYSGGGLFRKPRSIEVVNVMIIRI